MNVTNASLPVTFQKTLEHDGTFFSVTKPGDPDPVLTVPAGVHRRQPLPGRAIMWSGYRP